MRETGLKYRAEVRLYTAKPQCQGQTSFISIGFTECYFALVSMVYGALLSLVVLALEFLWYRRCGLAFIHFRNYNPTDDLHRFTVGEQ